MTNPYPETIEDECSSQIFKDDRHTAWNEGCRVGVEKVVREVEQLWRPRHQNLCYGIIDPHPDCICCKWLAKLKELRSNQ